jgi:hypothetical protein
MCRWDQPPNSLSTTFANSQPLYWLQIGHVYGMIPPHGHYGGLSNMPKFFPAGGFVLAFALILSACRSQETPSSTAVSRATPSLPVAATLEAEPTRPIFIPVTPTESRETYPGPGFPSATQPAYPYPIPTSPGTSGGEVYPPTGGYPPPGEYPPPEGYPGPISTLPPIATDGPYPGPTSIIPALGTSTPLPTVGAGMPTVPATPPATRTPTPSPTATLTPSPTLYSVGQSRLPKRGQTGS